ncbi:MAG: hypothetical protein JO257_07885 [Deltaproteobacteria bacterium]|nr:hypothetical protein [Deltaproteobacteria bacterium]
MSELAFNANGEAFEVPANVTGWRVRRMKPRGAPELVYGEDGGPLVVSIEATIDELRDAVVTAGKYRLDPVNDDGRCVEAVPPAYVQVTRPPRTAATAVAVPAATSDDTIREAMRMNTELARSVIEKFPEMMSAAAELLRAADGAGLPRREPRALAEADEVDDEEELDAPAASSSPGFELINTLIAQIVPIVVSGIASKGLPKLDGVLDWRKAKPKAEAKPAAPVVNADDDGDDDVEQEEIAIEETALPPLGPQQMAHFLAIQSSLKPEEAALARQLAAELSPTEMRTWLADLSALSVPDAVAKIRALLGGKAGGAA